MNSIEKKESAELSRPLTVLVPLIRTELEAGDAAGVEHYRKAGEMLIEAKDQCGHGEWVAWVERNFHLSRSTASRYMALVEIVKTRPRATFESLRQATRPDESTHHTKPPAWQAPVQRVVQSVNMKALVADEQSKAQEGRLLHALAEQLIDIGYKVLAAKLHPDKGGSREAMARLNKVRALLKEAI